MSRLFQSSSNPSTQDLVRDNRLDSPVPVLAKTKVFAVSRKEIQAGKESWRNERCQGVLPEEENYREENIANCSDGWESAMAHC